MLVATTAAATAFVPTSPEEQAYRTQLPELVIPGGCRCLPVHCNGNPGLLCLPRDPALDMQVRSFRFHSLRILDYELLMSSTPMNN